MMCSNLGFPQHQRSNNMEETQETGAKVILMLRSGPWIETGLSFLLVIRASSRSTNIVYEVDSTGLVIL